MGCVVVVRGFKKSPLNIKVKLKLMASHLYGGCKGGVREGAGLLISLSIKYTINLELNAKHWGNWGGVLYVVLTYLLKVALFLLIGVQYLQKSLVDLRLALEPILPNERKDTE